MIQYENTDNQIQIDCLSDFMQKIFEIKNNINLNEGTDVDSKKFFFRGQANCDWDVIPIIFRDQYLSNESEMVKTAYLRNPSEFRSLPSDFEHLAKFQHYGLPTRLLDVTANPLVALYFACQPCIYKDEKSNEEIEADGVVYYQQTYCKNYTDLEVSIISYLAIRGIENGLTIEELLEELEDKHIYTHKAATKCRSNRYNSLIKIIQSNYYVISNLNNERLIRQSGSFILIGRYNITIDENSIKNSIISSATSSVRDEFNQESFIIPANRKKDILRELDFCNINEATLFPELEHQMAYIKRNTSNKEIRSVASFSKVEFPTQTEIMIDSLAEKISDKQLNSIIDKVLSSSVNKIFIDECKIAIIDNLAVDWYKRESILSKIRIALSEVLRHNNMDIIIAKQTAKSIVDNLLKEVKEL